MENPKINGRKLLTYLPFVIAFLAFLVATYHIVFYR